MSEPGARAGNRRLAAFFGLTFLWAWGLWIAVALSGADVSASAWAIAYHLGGWAPSLVGVFLLYRTSRDRAERRDFWRRVVDVRLISLGWYLVILLLIPALAAIGVWLDALLSGTAPTFEVLAQIRANPLFLVLLVVVGIIQGPLSEELGWRGLALDGLQARVGALASSVILGATWALWHLPLFAMRGTPQYAQGMGSLFFWLFLAIGVPLSILMTWAYNHNGQSILSGILLHFVLNWTFTLFYPVSDRAMLYLVILMSLAAVGMVLSVGPREPDTAS